MHDMPLIIIDDDDLISSQYRGPLQQSIHQYINWKTAKLEDSNVKSKAINYNRGV